MHFTPKLALSVAGCIWWRYTFCFRSCPVAYRWHHHWCAALHGPDCGGAAQECNDRGTQVNSGGTRCCACGQPPGYADLMLQERRAAAAAAAAAATSAVSKSGPTTPYSLLPRWLTHNCSSSLQCSHGLTNRCMGSSSFSDGSICCKLHNSCTTGSKTGCSVW